MFKASNEVVSMSFHKFSRLHYSTPTPNVAATFHPPLPNAEAIALQVSSCSDLNQLRRVFGHIIRTHFLQLHPHPFHYNNISRIYSRLNSPTQALRVYSNMARAGIQPDNFTLPIVLKAAAQILDPLLAKQLHGASIKHALENDTYCESGLISVYSKTGQFENARKVFDESPERKIGSWNAIIGGLSQGGRSRKAIHMFMSMMREGFSPDDVTMVSANSACGSLGDLNLALQLHKLVFQATSLERSDTLMNNSVIDMYGKCGRMDLARGVFVAMEEKNVFSWTSMIVGHVSNGEVGDARTTFERMMEKGVRPNHVTFVGVLSACVHGGMVEEGKRYFHLMREGYKIEPTMAHYGCMVDLLGRAGLLDEAKMMVEEMPMKANVVVWGCLMGACEKYGNVRIGEWVAQEMMEIEPENDGVFVVLSNIYASCGLWGDVERLRGVMKERKVAKVPGYSLPEFESEVANL